MKKYVLFYWVNAGAYSVIDTSKDDSMSFHTISGKRIISHDHFSYEDYNLGPVVFMTDELNELNSFIAALRAKEGDKFNFV